MVLLAACGPSQGEKEAIAAVTCSIIGETRNMDAAIRVREMNDARVKVGGEPFLGGDDAIKESLEWGLCKELVLNESYDETLQVLKDAKRKRERLAAEEKAEKEKRMAEMAAEAQRMADSKPTIEETFHSNGKLQSRTNYQPKSNGGKAHGLSEYFFDNGQLRLKRNYKDGEEDGLSERYFQNGQLQFKNCYKNGEDVDMSYCEK